MARRRVRRVRSPGFYLGSADLLVRIYLNFLDFTTCQPSGARVSERLVQKDAHEFHGFPNLKLPG